MTHTSKSDIESVMAEMRAKLDALPRNDALIDAIAKRRHESAIAAGVRCPKHLNCAICDADRLRREMEKAMGPDHSREGVFVYHNCWRCDSGKKPCPKGNPRNCENLYARND